jgi:hypothetical protein
MEKKAIEESGVISLINKMKTEQEFSVLMNGCSQELDYATWCVIKKVKKGLRIISKDLVHAGKKAEQFWMNIDLKKFQQEVVEIYTPTGLLVNNVGAGQVFQNNNCYEGVHSLV